MGGYIYDFNVDCNAVANDKIHNNDEKQYCIKCLGL